MFSDGYDFKQVDDIVYEVDAATMVVQEGDVDIGANPSAEEQQEALENGGQQVINIVHSFRLQPTTFDKKSYLTYLKVCILLVAANSIFGSPLLLHFSILIGLHEDYQGSFTKRQSRKSRGLREEGW